MSKINVKEIESVTTNGNLKVVPDGSGVLNVGGDSSGTLQLTNASGNGVKLKAPSNSSGQSYTLTLPTSSPTQDQYLHVDSITGSGSTAVGQLGYQAIAPVTANQINANEVVSGTMPASRYNTAGLGGGLQLIENTVLSADVFNVTYSNLAPHNMYKVICKNVELQTTDKIYIDFLNSTNNSQTNLLYSYQYGNSDTYDASNGMNFSNIYVGDSYLHLGFEATICTGDPNATSQRTQRAWMFCRAMARDRHSSYIGWTDYQYGTNGDTKNISGIKIYHNAGNYLKAGSQFMLYKYNEG
tara:strand:+ start:994 stop:1887 length:894 start_codon:yes stop_codon:yes gene_type:complete